MIVEVRGVSLDGDIGGKNVGISNINPDEKSGHRKPQVSWATIIVPGLGDPKPTTERCCARWMSGLIFPPYLIFII